MTRRWTLVRQRIGSQDPIRSSEVARRSTGLRYWLLVPFAGFAFYFALFWSIITGHSFLHHWQDLSGEGRTIYECRSIVPHGGHAFSTTQVAPKKI